MCDSVLSSNKLIETQNRSSRPIASRCPCFTDIEQRYHHFPNRFSAERRYTFLLPSYISFFISIPTSTLRSLVNHRVLRKLLALPHLRQRVQTLFWVLAAEEGGAHLRDPLVVLVVRRAELRSTQFPVIRSSDGRRLGCGPAPPADCSDPPRATSRSLRRRTWAE